MTYVSPYLNRPLRPKPQEPTVFIVRDGIQEVGRIIKVEGFRYAVWRGRTLLAYMATLEGARQMLQVQP
jgi:hypothetical protein